MHYLILNQNKLVVEVKSGSHSAWCWWAWEELSTCQVRIILLSSSCSIFLACFFFSFFLSKWDNLPRAVTTSAWKHVNGCWMIADKEVLEHYLNMKTDNPLNFPDRDKIVLSCVRREYRSVVWYCCHRQTKMLACSLWNYTYQDKGKVPLVEKYYTVWMAPATSGILALLGFMKYLQ